MSKNARVLVVLASLGLLSLFVLPLWHIGLEAPQYPEGLGMKIWINGIQGDGPHDLQNINGLNHYIGMKAIEPGAIPELRVFPWVVGFLGVLGLVVAVVGRRWLQAAWTLGFVAFAVVGLVDFYRWEYDYGHNLDQDLAIIKIPGMSYQPPLIGSRQILNFTAHSWPAAGGWLAILGGFLAVGALGYEILRRRRERRPERAGLGAAAALGPALLLVALGLGACAPGPEPIVYGEDACDRCRMGIADERYGAELVTTRGKVYKFDSVECLAAFASHDVEPDEIHSLWVTDFRNPSRLIPVRDAFFFHSEGLRSPMGMNLAAFGEGIDEDSLRNALPGAVLSWEEVVALVDRGWKDGGGQMSLHTHRTQ